jgi:ADP-ribose pyrophosphatase
MDGLDVRRACRTEGRTPSHFQGDRYVKRTKTAPRKKKITRKKKVLACGAHLRLVCVGKWEYAERADSSGVVAIVAVTDDGKLILTEQYREAVHAPVIDLAAGLAGDEGDKTESLETAARRELREECGYDAAELVHLTDVPTSAGLTSETVAIFRARGLRRVGSGGGNHSESITVHKVSLAKIDSWLTRRQRAGALIDVKVYTGLYFALNR